MTTSGTASFNLDLNELVEEAFERCGAELRTGYDLRTARRSLNLLFADWANRGINLWTIEQGEINLVQGQATYALPVDTVDLLEHVIRTQAGSVPNQADLTITRISVSTYATIPNKLTQGRPIQVWERFSHYRYLAVFFAIPAGCLTNCFPEALPALFALVVAAYSAGDSALIAAVGR